MRNGVKIAAALALLASTAMGGTALAQKKAPPAPKGVITVSMPNARIPEVTDFYKPFLSSSDQLIPLDLKAHGYDEVEAIVTGKANVYQWGKDGGVEVAQGGHMFGTRVLIRKPTDKTKFSGNVVVEIVNDARSFDWVMMWGYMKEHMMRTGDAFAIITPPKATIGLKKWDAARYADLNFSPGMSLACRTGENGDVMEEGLRFDVLAQVGALMKNNTASGNPLAGYNVKHLFMTAQSGGQSDLTTYAMGLQNTVRLPGNKPIYDGYLFKGIGGVSRLSHCATAPAATDPHNMLKNVGVPIVAVVSQADYPGQVRFMREDSDAPNDQFRVYQIAAGPHLDKNAYDIFPALADQTKAGNLQGTVQYPFTARCTPEYFLSASPLMKYAFDAGLSNLEGWANGVVPPKAPRFVVAADGKLSDLDQYGYAKGGVRSPWSDAPDVVTVMGGPGPGNCPELGHDVPMSWKHLTSVYGTPAAREAKALPVLDQMLAQKMITPDDAELARAEIRAPAALPGRNYP